jgi:tRNA(Arg) A34 adenosine deaminase TadA
MTDADYMRVAITKAREGIAAGQSPFGAVIVLQDQVIAGAHNTVWLDGDPTAHAEVNAIRRAAETLPSVFLPCGVMYTTCEPCPMCLAAIHWSKIDRVVYGAGIADAAAAGFSELSIAAAAMVRLGGSRLRVEAGMLPDECRALFALWKNSGLARPY